jgi:hypothetical protein
MATQYPFQVKDGRENTDGSCAVLAIAVATGCKYDTAYWCARAIGFRPGFGTPMYKTKEVTAAILEHTDHQYCLKYNVMSNEAPHLEGEQPTTLRRVLKRWPRGRFLVSVKGHIFAVVNGEVIDNGYLLPVEVALATYGRTRIYRVAEVVTAMTAEPSRTAGLPATQLSLF